MIFTNLSKCVLTLFSIFSTLKIVLGEPPDVIIHENEDKSGNRSFHFYDLIGGFYDVQAIVNEHGMEKVGLLCGRGVFIVYNNNYFVSHADDDAMILAGAADYSCVPPGHTMSVLPAQSYVDHLTDTIAIFKGERMSVPYEIITGPKSEDPESQSRVQRFGDIKSLILMGKGAWIIETRTERFCLKAGLESEFPICPVAYTKCLVGHKEVTSWISAEYLRHGECPMDMKAHFLKYCFELGSGHLESIGNDTGEGTNLQPREVNKIEIYDTCDDDAHGEEFAVLTKIRLSHDFDSLYQIQFPLNKIHSWRTEVLDNSIKIATSLIPLDLLNHHFLHIVREYFIYLIEKFVWANLEGWPTNKPTQRMLLVAHETRRCVPQIMEKGWDGKVQMMTSAAIDYSGLEIPDKHIDITFRTIKGYDIITEFIWLVINYAGAACHAVLEFETDFWMDYMNVAYDMYLVPMASFWGNPDPIYQFYYSVILGGYDIYRQYNALAAATSLMYKTVTLDQLPRPAGVKEAAHQENPTGKEGAEVAPEAPAVPAAAGPAISVAKAAPEISPAEETQSIK